MFVNRDLLREFVAETVLAEGFHRATDQEVRDRVISLRENGNDALASALENTWVLHDKLGDEMTRLQRTTIDEKSSERVMKLADDLVRVFKTFLVPALTEVPDMVEEAVSDSDKALERSWNAQMRSDYQTMSQELSFGVQYPIHNSLEYVLSYT
jgi:hypothetical protein